MSELVNWRKAYEAARWWVTPTTPWHSTLVSGENDHCKECFAGTDCFYVSRGIIKPNYNCAEEILKISLDGTREALASSLALYGDLKMRQGNLFWCPGSGDPVPVGHTNPYTKEDFLPSWNSTPGPWTTDGTCVYGPDGYQETGSGRPIGVYCDKPVRCFSWGIERMKGHYHLISNGDVTWCRNLLKSGPAPDGGKLEEEFFQIPAARFYLYHQSSLYYLSFVDEKIKLFKSGVAPDE